MAKLLEWPFKNRIFVMLTAHSKRAIFNYYSEVVATDTCCKSPGILNQDSAEIKHIFTVFSHF